MAKFSIGYIIALFELALENSKMDKYLEDSKSLLHAIEENEKFTILMNSPQIDLEEKYSLIDNAFGEWIEKEIINALKILAQRHDFSLLSKVLKGLIDKINHHKGITSGIVYSISPLDDEKVKEIEESTTKRVGFKVSLINKIDKELKFGFKIIVKDIIIEDSAVSRLNAIKNKLLEGGAL